MRMTLYMSFGSGLEIPINYRHLLQGLLYRFLGNHARFSSIHDRKEREKTFKPFTFSPLIGRFDIRPNKRISFSGRVSWTVSSYDVMLFHYLYNSFNGLQHLTLGNVRVPIEDIFIHPNYPATGSIEMLSPCTVWKTTYENERKIIKYETPLTEEFSLLVKNNALAKYKQFFEKDYEGVFEFYPMSVGLRDKSVTYYKKTRIEGWNGKFHLKADEEMSNLLHGIGIGGKNAQGYGLFKWIEESGKKGE